MDIIINHLVFLKVYCGKEKYFIRFNISSLYSYIGTDLGCRNCKIHNFGRYIHARHYHVFLFSVDSPFLHFLICIASIFYSFTHKFDVGAWISEFMFLFLDWCYTTNLIKLILYVSDKKWKCSNLNPRCTVHVDRRKRKTIDHPRDSDDLKKNSSCFASTFMPPPPPKKE